MARHEIPWITVFSVHHGERGLPPPNPGYERSPPDGGRRDAVPGRAWVRRFEGETGLKDLLSCNDIHQLGKI